MDSATWPNVAEFCSTIRESPTLKKAISVALASVDEGKPVYMSCSLNQFPQGLSDTILVASF